MANKLLVEIIGDASSLVRSFNQSTVAANKFGVQVDQGVGRAEKSFSRFQKLAAGGFIGGALTAGAITAFKSVAAAAAESQQVLGQTKVALEATGLSWAQYGKQVEEAVQKQSKLGFDDENLLRTFSLFVRQTKDVGQALVENNLAMDVARARFISLDQAAQLVNKAALGQAGALRRLGIDTEGATKGTELLALLTTNYGGAAQAAGHDAQTSLDRVNVSIENLKESIGTLSQPILTTLADDLAAAADVASRLVSALQGIGQVEIPTIHIPFAFDIPGGGSTVADLAGKAFDIGKFTPLNPLFGATIAAKIASQFDDGAQVQVGPLADKFAESIGGLTTNALNQAAGKVKVEPGKVKGFGAGLKPSDLFGPLITEIPQRLQEKLLDVKIAAPDNLVKQLAVLTDEKAVLEKALQDPRLTAKKRIDVKKLLEGVVGGIGSLEDQIAAESERASSERAAKLEKAAAAAKASSDRQKAALLKIAQHREEVRKAALEALQGKQFKALGLSESGDEIVPGVKNLAKRFESLSDQVAAAGSSIGTKLSARFKLAGKLIKTDGKKLTEETRKTINDLFKAVNDALNQKLDSGNGPLTKGSSFNLGKTLEGLVLPPGLEETLRQRLSRFSTEGLGKIPLPQASAAPSFASAQPVVIQTTVELDGQKVGQSTKRFLQNDQRHNPRTRR